MLAAFILGSCACAHGEEGITFPVLLARLFNYDAGEWMSTGENRATFAACALLDYGIQDNIPCSLDNLYSGSVYVGRASFILIMGYSGYRKNQSLYVLYDVRDPDNASYAVFSFGRSALETTLEEVCTDGFYEVDLADLKSVVDSIHSALND